LEGALLLDVQSAEFDALAAELDPDASYIVYCRSGNRAGTAIERLAALGITDAVNAGSVQEASDATGIPIVTE
ncbi:MAG TPA: rhodanese-like domain-containing protein, partial [Microbacterium sp.]|nr:rhodanese-like domain-containing protein [Microbacterium sp.]